MAVHRHGKGNDDRQIHFEIAVSETGQSGGCVQVKEKNKKHKSEVALLKSVEPKINGPFIICLPPGK